ncbi:hypothetical protein C8R43DRAFT_955050 [Mycena crocata]|nr:hypothetical protein C8R43DRAFT_955050 [Mycena crocata]
MKSYDVPTLYHNLSILNTRKFKQSRVHKSSDFELSICLVSSLRSELGLPTIPVKTGVTGAVNGMPSRPVEPLAGEKNGTGAGRNQLPDTHLLHVNTLTGCIWRKVSPSRKLTVDGRLFAVPSRLKYLKDDPSSPSGLRSETATKILPTVHQNLFFLLRGKLRGVPKEVGGESP